MPSSVGVHAVKAAQLNHVDMPYHPLETRPHDILILYWMREES